MINIPMTYRILQLFGLLFLVGGCMANSFRADAVIQKSGAQEIGTIEKSSKEGVVIDGKTVKVGNIRFVLFSNEPKDLRTIRDSVAKGSFTKAEQALKRLDMSKVSGPLQKMDAEFYIAYVKARRALQTGQGVVPAVKGMLAFVKKYKDSFHFYDSAEVLGEMALALGKEEDAARYFSVLERSSAPAIKLRGMTRTTESLMTRSAFDEALQRYEAMLALSDDDDELRGTALLGKALCQAEMGDGQAGIATVEEIIQQTDSRKAKLMARAYNALGACYRATGQNNAAVLAYLHVDLLYENQSIQHAEALYHLGTLWSTVGHSDRAAQANAKLKQRYANSPWASK